MKIKPIVRMNPVANNGSNSRSKVLLNIVGGQKASHKQHKMAGDSYFDIISTRRTIINDTCELRNLPKTSTCNSLPFFTNNHLTTKPAQPNVVFSSLFLPQRTISGYSNNQLREHKTFQNRVDNFGNSRYKRTEMDDDVICLNTSVDDNAVTTIRPRNSSCIVVNDNNYDSKSVISLDTPDTTPDLSRFSIIVENTNCKILEDPPELQVNNSNSDDSVIFMGYENNKMDFEDDPSEEYKKSDEPKVDDDVISIDCSPVLESKPVRCMNIAKSTSVKQRICFKQKDRIAKKSDASHTSLSNRNIIRFARESESLLELTVPKKIKLKEPEPLMEKIETNEIENTECKNYTNVHNSGQIVKNGLREIIIDGSNVALGHTNGEIYSIEGIQIVIDYFIKRGHKVRAFVPKFRLSPGRSSNPELLRQLVTDKHVILTPSRPISGRRITPYDDRYIIQYATLCEGIVVSSDCFRDLINENTEWKNTIDNRLLMPTWIGDVLMFPEDPLGRFGPKLDDFLKFPSS